MSDPIRIDPNQCIGCGQCVRDCPAGCLTLKDRKADYRPSGCLECGHCFAVCPAGAVSMPGYDTADCVPCGGWDQLDPRDLLLAMKSRRSVRQFTADPVTQEQLEAILEAGRYAPTGTNAQDLHFTVLDARKAEAEALCVGLFRKAQKAAAPILKALGQVEIDDSYFFKGAPVVLVVSSKSSLHAGLASSYMEMLAGSLGLGVLYSGFFILCIRMSRKLRDLLDLPDGYKARSCLVIGHPAVTYQRTVPRKPLSLNKV